ncbi:type VI secretion system Vgr family protein [Aerolutibacter ruishenii]|uniref:Rhs element Vgr protein n=1 Tax=Aerolutibacter ruishenii TaxID=686800 RepID=A0A562M2K1_9GAMM|nr:type VI secretion system Vgr family protein [Lysobacter ruishenii]TWI14165.1 Rhs element Vgr protein [Lysobacter ruishenii]
MNSGVSVPGRLADWLRLSGAARPHSLEVPALAPAHAAWVVTCWHGREALGPHPVTPDLVLAEYWVDLLATSPDLTAAIGQPATLATRAADGSGVSRSGLVASVQQRGGDLRAFRHRLQLVPWPWLLTQSRHSRVFQQAGLLAIVQTVLADYSPWADWRVADDVGPFLAHRPLRSYCVQYRESDAHFLARLLAEEGLGVRLEEAPDAPAGHRLVIFSDSTVLPDVSTASTGIRLHRADAAEEYDAITAIGVMQTLGATSLTVLGTDYRTMTTVTAAAPLHRPSGLDVGLEHYAPLGAYPFASRTHAEHAVGLMACAMEAQQAQWVGTGTARGLRAGVGFRLLAAPQEGGATPPSDLAVLGVWHAGTNPLPEGLQVFGDGLPDAVPDVDATTWAAVRTTAHRVGYANAFIAQPRAKSWRPMRVEKARVGYQTARVVGPDGALHANGAHELNCDAMGRIRVRFHWQDGDVAGPRSDGNEAATALDSCWLRVAQRYAGPGFGMQFLPRIGQEVLVAFLEGDVDRPVVVGTVYNGRGDPAPGGKGNLSGGAAPPWHGASPGPEGDRNAAAMVGFKSKEFGGAGHNRLVLDDSDGELRLQLATTHAASELTLGYLIHQDDNHRGAARGGGFELRTDLWGALRAERGLWISAYGANEDAPAGEHVSAVALLKQAAELAASMSGIAITHTTCRLSAHAGVNAPGQSALAADAPPLRALHASARALVPGADWLSASTAPGVSGTPARAAGKDAGKTGGADVPHMADALLGLAAPAGIGLVAGQSLHWSTGKTLTLASGQASNLAVAGDLRLHAGQAIGWLAGTVEGALEEDVALSLVTAEGDLDLQAQNDSIKLQAREGLRVVSAHAEVELAAGKAVHLATSGGASITIEGGNIAIACPGQITVHAGRKEFVGPAHLSREMNNWPQSRFDQRYVVRDRVRGTPMANMRVEVSRQDGAILRLVTDGEGRLPIQKGLGPEQVRIRVLGKE